MKRTLFDFQAHVEFIEEEFRHEFRTVIDQITLPIPQRVDLYTCWPGLVVLRSNDSDGRVVLGFKRNPSKLRLGEHVYVNALSVEPKDVIIGPQGIIERLDEAGKTCTIKAGYQQAGRFTGRFRIGDRIVLDQTLPGEHLGREMPTLAMRFLGGEFGDVPRLRKIRGILSGEVHSKRVDGAPYSIGRGDPAERLTEAQRAAVAHAVDHDLTLIQGPPGTGKTHVLGVLIREFVRRKKKVAVSAFTHQAINNVLRECMKYSEIGSVCKISGRESWHGAAVDERLEFIQSPGAYFRRKERPDVTGLTHHAAFGPVARAIGESGKEALPEHFDVIVFDEAGQLMIPAAAMTMIHADHWVFAGDHRQLKPMVASRRAHCPEARSIFRHLAEEVRHPVQLLDTTFRMNRDLLAFPDGEFYQNRLHAAPEAAERRLEGRFTGRTKDVLDPDHPVTLALVRHEGRGQESPEEAALIAELVVEAHAGGVPLREIAVIAPHRRQNVKIKESLARRGLGAGEPLVDTVERIQGQERDLVILGMTLSDPDLLSAESDFLFMPERFNVAITRARRKLVVVASPAFFRALPERRTLEREASRALRDINVLKRWYFQHRSSAVDMTDLAMDLASATEPENDVAERAIGSKE